LGKKPQTQVNRNSRYVPVFLTTTSWGGQPLVSWFTEQIKKELVQSTTKGDFQSLVLDSDQIQNGSNSALLDYFDQLKKRLAPRQLLVMIDEFQLFIDPKKDESRPFFKGLESILDTFREVSFIFACAGSLPRGKPYDELIQPVLALCPPPIHLDVLDSRSAQDLIYKPVHPLTYEEGVVEKVLELTIGHPYYIHLLCWDMMEQSMKDSMQGEFKGRLTNSYFRIALNNLLRNDGAFYHLLYAVPDTEKILINLAQLASKPDRWVEFELLARCLESDFDVNRLRQAIKNLIGLEILEESKNGNLIVTEHGRGYRFNLPIDVKKQL
jgi:hypothetical protein